MKGVRAAVRYAKALLQLAAEKQLTEQVVQDARMVHALISESKDLTLLLNSPLVRADKKEAVLTEIFSGKVQDLSLKLIQQTVQHNRENLLGVIFEQMITQYNNSHRIAKVDVSTAIPLEESIKEEISKKFIETFKLSKVELNEEVDEDLIGGLVLRMGDKQLDASIRRQLNDIKKELV
ncbi:MAG: ATP synthase F1 subunit delta [Vicingaceae bacterium]